jgi:antitoxin FitA
LLIDKGAAMADLVLRNVDEKLVARLEEVAGLFLKSPEAYHLEILEHGLEKTRNRAFIEDLMRMPNVGDDDDFARV